MLSNRDMRNRDMRICYCIFPAHPVDGTYFFIWIIDIYFCIVRFNPSILPHPVFALPLLVVGAMPRLSWSHDVKFLTVTTCCLNACISLLVHLSCNNSLSILISSFGISNIWHTRFIHARVLSGTEKYFLPSSTSICITGSVESILSIAPDIPPQPKYIWSNICNLLSSHTDTILRASSSGLSGVEAFHSYLTLSTGGFCIIKLYFFIFESIL